MRSFGPDRVFLPTAALRLSRCSLRLLFCHCLLLSAGVDIHGVDVLSNATLRTYMKEYSDWPTFPQLYVAGASASAQAADPPNFPHTFFSPLLCL